MVPASCHLFGPKYPTQVAHWKLQRQSQHPKSIRNKGKREGNYNPKSRLCLFKVVQAYMEPHHEQQPPSTPTSPTSSQASSSSIYNFVLKVMSKRRTWVWLFVVVYAILLSCCWNLLKSILSWYQQQEQLTATSSSLWPAVYASVLLGAVFGLLSMVVALAVAVPTTLVIWITVVVLLAFCGKPRRALVIEGRKITREIIVFVFKILLKEGNAVAAVCAILGYFALVRRNSGLID